MTFQKNILAFLFFAISFALSAQSSDFRGQSEISLGDNQLSVVKSFPIENDGPFLSFCVKAPTPANDLLIRYSENGNTWEAWQSVEDEIHAQEGEVGWISAMGFIDAKFRFYQLQSVASTEATIHFFNPQFTERVNSSNSIISGRSCSCSIPEFKNRSQWCPAGNCPEHPDPSYTQVTHLIVHHSAGANSSSDWAAVVRSIWSFHVNDRGWSDIGYNWLVAPSGQIFQGRGDNILGAHFCGTNGKTMGVCMMGTYMTVLSTDTSVVSLQKLLSWKACQEDIDPVATKYHGSSGKYLKQISGHRDGCATSCPGDFLYPTLPEIRNEVNLKVDNNCANIYAPAPLSGSPSGNQVLLSWVDNSENEMGFLLEKKEAGAIEFSLLASLPLNSNSYMDEGLEDGVYYAYRLRSYNDQDTSIYSNELWLTTGGVATEDQFINKSTVSFFPNPTTSNITLNIENELLGNIDIEILTPDMKVIKKVSLDKVSFSQSRNINLKSSPAGLYFVKVKQGNRSGVFRIIKAE